MRGWSLRHRLFVIIVLPLIAVAFFAAAARYLMAERTSQQLYDNTLLAVALTISRDVVLSEGDMLAEELLDELTKALGDPVYYRVTGPDGRFVTGYSDPPSMPEGSVVEKGVPYFYNSSSADREVRVVILQEFLSEPQFGGWVTVEVWQTTHQRAALSVQLLVQAVALMGLVIAAAALLVWFGISLGLRPLLELHQAIALRSPDDLTPIRRRVPPELQGLVGAMNSLFARVSEAFLLRDAFISDAAHQLRNPIAAIQAQAEAAKTAPDVQVLRSRVSELAETAQRTGRVTQQLLSMEKARGRGAVSGIMQPTDLRALIENHARTFAERALRLGIALSFQLKGTPVAVRLDAVMVGEALDNLLDNAMTYGCKHGGNIEVGLGFEPGAATVWVSDDGPGVPPDLRDRVFDRFFRIGDDAGEGCGLGLSIVQRVAEAHGGSAWIVPQEKGTRVVFALPV